MQTFTCQFDNCKATYLAKSGIIFFIFMFILPAKLQLIHHSEVEHPSPKKGEDGKNILYVRAKSRQKISMEGIDAYCAKHYNMRTDSIYICQSSRSDSRKASFVRYLSGLLPCNWSS